MKAKKIKSNGNLLKFSKVKDVEDLKSKALTIGFYGVAGFLGYKFLLKPSYLKYKKKSEQMSILTDPNKQQATYLYNAMNPSGISWMRSFDNTNESMIYAAGRKITNWNAVQRTYQNLYNRNLLSDLQSDLDNKEFKTFLNIVDAGKSNNIPKSNGILLATSKAVRLRSTPDSSIKSYSFNSNIYGVAQANTFLGWSTGIVKVDNRGVKYYQVMISFDGLAPYDIFRNISKKQNSQSIKFWVGSGAIYQFSSIEKMLQSGIKIPKGIKLKR